jgi:Zn-dependent protease
MIGNLDATYLIVLIVCILVSLVIHEFMHAYAGYLLGDNTAKQEGRLSLNPLSHIDPFMTVILPVLTLLLFSTPVLAAKPVPFDMGRVRFEEFGGALIALAGPASNFVLAFIGALLQKYLELGPFLHDALGIFVVLNVAICVFNLVPIPPLDGSRVLYAFAPEPVQDFMRAIEPYGLIIIFALVFTVGLGGFLVNINEFVLNLLP